MLGGHRDARACRLSWGSCLFLAAGATACWDEVLQTARRGPPIAEDGGSGGAGSSGDCSEPAPLVALPEGAAWGEGGEAEDWLFTRGSYAGSQGPGLFVTARDAFRLYVNGHLLVEREEGREPVFLPLSLPPGENVVALVVAAESGPAAALVHLDELERSWVSGGDWKVSSSPSGAWRTPGYDDSGWTAARELALFGGWEGCDPTSGFAAGSAARWIGAGPGANGPIALRKTIRIEPVGFGASTTGGAGAEPVVVSSWEELTELARSDDPVVIVLEEGDHDFRRQGEEIAEIEVCPEVCSSDPEKTLLHVLVRDETCEEPMVTAQRDERILRVGSNKTVLGLGRGASVRGVTFDLHDSRNVIVRNVAVYDVNPTLLEAGDAFGLNRSARIWIDHATVQWVSDGFTDILAGSREVTLSYLHYDGRNDAACAGLHRVTSEITDAEVTIHHCRYEHVSSRAPMVRGAEAWVHLFNNVHSNNQDWSVGARCLGQVLLEGSTFENVAAATYRADCPDVPEDGLIFAPEGSNLYRDEAVVHRGGDGGEPRDAVFEPPYEYELELANQAWPIVVSRAGAGGPWARPLSR